MNPSGRIRWPRPIGARASCRGGRASAPAAGYSLLEVILALAIFAGALAVLGESARQAIRNAAAARDLTCAQLLCESKMAETVAGGSVPQPVEPTAFDVSAYPSGEGWLYAIRVEPTDQDGLIAVRITVTRDDPPAAHPLELSLVRWMIDPQSASQAAASDSAKTDKPAPQKAPSTSAMQPTMNRMQSPPPQSKGGSPPPQGKGGSPPPKNTPTTQNNNRGAGS